MDWKKSNFETLMQMQSISNWLNDPRSGQVAWWMSLLLNAAWVLLVFASLSNQQLFTYFNSDTLYLPSIFRDLFEDGSGIRGWHLNAAPNFFPDMAGYFLFNAVFRDFKLAMLLYSLFQYMALLALLRWMLRTAFPAMPLHYLALGNLLMLLFLFVSRFSGDFVFSFYLLSISYHLGPFMMTLGSLVCLISYLNTRKASWLAALAVLLLLGVISNRLFIVMFVFPSMVLWIMAWKKPGRRMVLKPLLVMLGAAVAGLVLFNLIKGAGIIHVIGTEWKTFRFSQMGASFHIMAGQHGHYIRSMDFRGVIQLISLISFLLTSGIAIGETYRLLRKDQADLSRWVIWFYPAFSSVFFLIVLFNPVVNGSYVGWAILRYNVQVFYLAVFNGAYLLYYFTKARGADMRLARIAAVWLVVGMAVFTGVQWITLPVRKGLSNTLNYYPAHVACVDAFARATGHGYGVAEYWYAKQTTMFSRAGVRIYTLHPSGAIWYHVMNRNWYYAEGRGRHARPAFRFVITHGLDTDILVNMLGEPLQIHPCQGSLQIWEYPEFVFKRDSRRPRIKEPAD